MYSKYDCYMDEYFSSNKSAKKFCKDKNIAYHGFISRLQTLKKDKEGTIIVLDSNNKSIDDDFKFDLIIGNVTLPIKMKVNKQELKEILEVYKDVKF